MWKIRGGGWLWLFLHALSWLVRREGLPSNSGWACSEDISNGGVWKAQKTCGACSSQAKAISLALTFAERSLTAHSTFSEMDFPFSI